MIIKDNNKITTIEMMNKFKKKFDTYLFWSEEELYANFPPPNESTEREFKDEQESSDYKGKSWDEIDNKESMMTFREYIIAFEQYYDKTGKYLDKEGFTLFRDKLPGSDRLAYGSWCVSGARALFSWRFRYGCGPGMGSRVAISLNP